MVTLCHSPGLWLYKEFQYCHGSSESATLSTITISIWSVSQTRMYTQSMKYAAETETLCMERCWHQLRNNPCVCKIAENHGNVCC